MNTSAFTGNVDKQYAVCKLCFFQKEDVILSSQSSDDMFNEEPWRTLMEELGTDGQRLLHNFSIASNLNRVMTKNM